MPLYHIDEDHAQIKVPSWDLYSFAIIFLALFLQLLRWELFPIFIDIYYHLSAMLGFNAAGGYVLNSFWEYAPIGRPHLYPPLLQIIMLGLYKVGFSKIFIVKFLSFTIFPFALFIIWLFMKKIFNERLAFFAVLTASSVYPLYIALLTRMPASLSLLCGLISFLCVEQGRKIAAVVFLAYSFYLHAFIPWIIVISFCLYCVFNSEKRKNYVVTMSLSILAAAPLIVRQYLNRGYFITTHIGSDRWLEINVLTTVFGLVGFLRCLRLKSRYYFPASLAIGFLVLLPVHPYQYLSREGIFSLIPLTAIGLDYFYKEFWRKRSPFIYIGLAVILFSLAAPTVEIEKPCISASIFNSTFTNLLSISKNINRIDARSALFPKFYNDIVASIKENSNKEDIIFSNMNYFAGVIGALSDRATSNGMLREIKPKEGFDPVSVATIVIWLKDPDAVREEPAGLIKRYALRKIKETDLAFIYKNDSATAKMRVNKAIVPNAVIFAFFFASLGLAAFDLSLPKTK